MVIMSCEMSYAQKKANTTWSYSHVEAEKVDLTEVKCRRVVIKALEWREGGGKERCWLMMTKLQSDRRSKP